jgi:hypothetical protein
LTYQDTTCAGGTTYYYKVRVYLGSYYDYSDLSDYDSGYKKNYGFITGWGSTGAGDGEFDSPFGVAVDFNGKVYVTEYWNHRVQKFQ